MKVRSAIKASGAAVLTAAGLCAYAVAAQTPAAVPVPPGGVLSLMASFTEFALHETEDHAECPQGFNSSHLQNYMASFPSDEARAAWEKKYGYGYAHRGPKGENVYYYPMLAEDPLPFRMAEGKTGLGLNLDGKVGPNDYTSPDGRTGIDNQMYRLLGCIEGQRGSGLIRFNFHRGMRTAGNRIIFEISGVDSTRDDPEVTIRTYIGLNPIYTSSADKPLAGGTQLIDYPRSAKYAANVFKGRIADGVLFTEPTDFPLPWASLVKDMRLEVQLTPNGAAGFIGGYADVKDWYRSYSTRSGHSTADAAGWSPPSLYRALLQLADAKPDASGHNTAISAAWKTEFVGVFLVHNPAREEALQQAMSR